MPIVCAISIVCAIAAGLSPDRAGAEAYYTIDQRFGAIAFAADHMGLFTSPGQFAQFNPTLSIDPGHPERSQITAEVDAASVDAPWQDEVAMLRSPDFLDVQDYPKIEFHSTAVDPAASDHTS